MSTYDIGASAVQCSKDNLYNYIVPQTVFGDPGRIPAGDGGGGPAGEEQGVPQERQQLHPPRRHVPHQEQGDEQLSRRKNIL